MNVNRKHVRFDTPSKSNPRLMERQSPLPSAYFRDDSDMEYSPKLKQIDKPSIADYHSSEPFGAETANVSPSSILNYQAPNFNPPLRSFKQNISPKPSHELELSLLDSTPHDFMANRYKNVIPARKSNEDNFKQDYYSKTFQSSKQDEDLSKKVDETDMPYTNLPTKTPIPKSIFSLPSSLMAKMPPVPLPQDTKEAPTDKDDTKDGFGFFTLPNSRSYFSEKNNQSSPKLFEDKSKNNHQFNSVIQAKNNYQHLNSGQNNHFNDHTTMNDRPDPRCCNDKPPELMPPPMAPVFFGTSHYTPNQNNPLNYPSNVAYHQYNENTTGRQQIYDPTCRQLMPVQPCCKYPNINNTNHCVTQRYHAQQYANANMHQTNNFGFNEHPKSLTMNANNSTYNPEDVNNAVDLKRKAIESRCIKQDVSNNNCSNIVKVVDNNIIIATNSVNKSEPTVSDLYQIIKLQNEQLQMLQQRVDKLLTVKEASNSNGNLTEDLMKPMHNLLGNQENILRKDSINMNCIEQSMHKISIGVMTSFEVVMSSNIVNRRDTMYNPDSKEINPSTHRDGCVQTSQMFENLKVTQNQFTEKQNVNYNYEKIGGGNNFLDGIAHCNKGNDPSFMLRNSNDNATSTKILNDACSQPKKCAEDNHTPHKPLYTQSKEEYIPMQGATKQLVPNSSVHLHAEEYSDSDDECSQPNAGWTFYNNVMNRVNDMLHSPPIPNKDIAEDVKHCDQQLVKSQRQRISTPVRYQDDFYVEKRQTPNHFNKPVSETSLHMKRLAAKYLSNNDESMRHESKVTFSPHVNIVTPVRHSTQVRDVGNEMSFATMQYMKRYHLLSVNGESGELPRSGKKMNPLGSNENYLRPIYKNPSRILDITALKQQPKLM